MAIDFKAPDSISLKPVITVLGVGGAGGNAVNNMIKANLQGANFVVANTDAQALVDSKCTNKIQLGATVTKGLGAGASAEVGAIAAEESADEIRSYLEGSNMVFITAGMGGGTGTGGSPVIAKIAKEMGILTVAVVTKPFYFEAKRRMRTARKGLSDLAAHVDTLIVIPNQNLFSVTNETTPFINAFEVADDVLRAGVQSVTDLIIMPGLINLDFADIKAIMSQMGKAMMGTGEASGEKRAIQAAESAIFNPLLDHTSIKGAKGVLINITGGPDMTLFEVDAAANRIREEVGEDTDANIIVGSAFNSDLKGIIRVSVIATGIEEEESTDASLFADETKSIATNNRVSSQDILGIESPLFDNSDLIDSNGTEPIYDNNEHLEMQNTGTMHPNFDLSSTHRDENIEEIENLNSTKKTSFLRKMWNSLKSSDKIVSKNPPSTATHKDFRPSQPTISSSLNHKPSDINEIPAIFRKQK